MVAAEALSVASSGYHPSRTPQGITTSLPSDAYRLANFMHSVKASRFVGVKPSTILHLLYKPPCTTNGCA